MRSEQVDVWQPCANAGELDVGRNVEGRRGTDGRMTSCTVMKCMSIMIVPQ